MAQAINTNYFSALSGLDFDAASAPSDTKKDAKAQSASQPAQPAQAKGKQATPSASALKTGGAAHPKGTSVTTKQTPTSKLFLFFLL